MVLGHQIVDAGMYCRKADSSTGIFNGQNRKSCVMLVSGSVRCLLKTLASPERNNIFPKLCFSENISNICTMSTLAGRLIWT